MASNSGETVGTNASKSADTQKIVLIGFMGSGKTVVGRALSRLLEWDFVDTDEEIEKVTGHTILQIFKKYGELRFRSEEELVLKKLVNRGKVVLATGGSMDLGNHNLEVIRDNSFFVLLQADLEILQQRLSRKNSRPLLGKKPGLERIEELLKARESQYLQMADHIINTSGLTVEEVALKIIGRIKGEEEALKIKRAKTLE